MSQWTFIQVGKCFKYCKPIRKEGHRNCAYEKPLVHINIFIPVILNWYNVNRKTVGQFSRPNSVILVL